MRYFQRSWLPIILLLVFQPAQAQPHPLPDWTHAGYRGTGVLPTDADFTTDDACLITPDELASNYTVIPDDALDDSAGLQQAINDIRDHCAGSYTRLSRIDLPSGTLNTSTEIHIDASFLVLRGQGAEGDSATKIVFEPDAETIYDGIPDFDLGAMEGAGTSNGGWIWPGRGAFRVQTRAVDEDYAEDYADAPANRRDFFEGSVNFHWKNGIVVTENSTEGDSTITLEDADALSVGATIWLGVPNTAKFLTEQGVLEQDWNAAEFMRQQIFTVTAIDGDTITLEMPLEFDLPHDSAADGSEPINNTLRDAKVVPLVVVEGFGFENFALTQVLPGHTPDEADFNYTNIDPLRALHGIVFKWATNSYVRGVHTFMTGSHPIVTEMVRNLQVEASTFAGSWNKGAGGNGYFRLSKAWESLIQNNTLIDLRHLAVQWSSSHNVIQGNTLDVDLNLHGGWERYNLFQYNTVRVPYEHRECSPNCSDGDETWFPIWWAAGAHAGSWAGASGAQNVFYDNVLQKQLAPGGAFEDFAPYGTSPNTVFVLGWDRATSAGSYWVPLTLDGVPIPTWTGNETELYQQLPNAGVNANCTSSAPSLVTASVECTG